MRRFTDVGDSLALESGETLSSSRTTGAKVDVRGRPVGTSRLAVAVAMVAERPPKRRVEDGMNAAPTDDAGKSAEATRGRIREGSADGMVVLKQS